MVVLGRLNEIAKQWIIDVSLSKVFEPLSFLISASYLVLFLFGPTEKTFT